MPTPQQLMAQATQMANQGGPGKNAAAAQAWLESQMKAQGFQTRSPQNDLLAQFDSTQAAPSAQSPQQTSGLLSEFDATPTKVEAPTKTALPSGEKPISLIKTTMETLPFIGKYLTDTPTPSQVLMQSGHPTLGGMTKGVEDVVSAPASLIARGMNAAGSPVGAQVLAGNKQENQAYEQARQAAAPQDIHSLITGQKDLGFDWPRFFGSAAATAPVTALKVFPGAGGLADAGAGAAVKGGFAQAAKQLINNAVQGGAAAALTSNQSDAPLGEQLASGAVLGAVLPPVANALIRRTVAPAVSGAINYARGLMGEEAPKAAGVIDDAMKAATSGATPQEQATGARTVLDQHAQELSDALKSTPQGADGVDMSKVPARVKALLNTSYLKNLTPEQQQRLLTFEALGIKDYTLADVTRNYADATATRNLAQNAELGAPIREADLAKNQQLLQAADRGQQMTGGQAGDSYSTGQQIQKAFEGQLNSINGKIQALYQQADNAAKGAPQVGTKPISQALSGLRSEFLASSDGKGLLNGIRARLQDFSGGPPANPGKVLLVDADGKPLLTEGDIPKGMTFQDSERFRQYLNDVWTPDNSRLVSKIKNAVDAAQDQAGGGDIYKQARFLRQQRAQMFENQDGVARIASGKVPVDRILDLYVNNKGNADALSQVVNQLKTGGNQDVLKNIKATVVKQMIDKATNAGGPNQAGMQNFSGLMFKRQLDNIGKKKLSILFTPQEQNYLGSLARGAVDLTTDPVVRNTFNPSGTASQATNTLDQIFGIGTKEVQGLKKFALKAAAGKIPGASVVKEVAAQAKDRAEAQMKAAKVAGAVNPNEAFATQDINAKQAAVAAQQKAQRDAIARALRMRAATAGAVTTQQQGQ